MNPSNKQSNNSNPNNLQPNSTTQGELAENTISTSQDSEENTQRTSPRISHTTNSEIAYMESLPHSSEPESRSQNQAYARGPRPNVAGTRSPKSPVPHAQFVPHNTSRGEQQFVQQQTLPGYYNANPMPAVQHAQYWSQSGFNPGAHQSHHQTISYYPSESHGALPAGNSTPPSSSLPVGVHAWHHQYPQQQNYLQSTSLPPRLRAISPPGSFTTTSQEPEVKVEHDLTRRNQHVEYSNSSGASASFPGATYGQSQSMRETPKHYQQNTNQYTCAEHAPYTSQQQATFLPPSTAIISQQQQQPTAVFPPQQQQPGSTHYQSTTQSTSMLPSAPYRQTQTLQFMHQKRTRTTGQEDRYHAPWTKDEQSTRNNTQHSEDTAELQTDYQTQLPRQHHALNAQTAQSTQTSQPNRNIKKVATTKTTIYTILRGEYLRLSKTSGRQDAYRSGRVEVPSFARLEEALGSVSNINAARISLLRSRQVMKDTFNPIRHVIHPTLPEMYAINSITTACPLCANAIALNKLGSYENWCKHLERHNETGRQIAARFRAIDKNSEVIPSIDVELATTTTPWTPLPMRQDMAALDDDPRRTDPRIVPLTTSIHWQSLVLNQMLKEGALDATSILTQEVAVMGSFYFGLVNQRSPEKFGQYPQLQQFQSNLHATSSAAYDVYSGVGIKEHSLGINHTRGHPVVATKQVVKMYHHYCLSHKSLQRGRRASASQYERATRTSALSLRRSRQNSTEQPKCAMPSLSEETTSKKSIGMNESSDDSSDDNSSLEPVKSPLRRQSELQAAQWLSETEAFNTTSEIEEQSQTNQARPPRRTSDMSTMSESHTEDLQGANTA